MAQSDETFKGMALASKTDAKMTPKSAPFPIQAEHPKLLLIRRICQGQDAV